MLRIVEDVEVVVGQLVGLVGLVGLDQLLDQVQHAPELVRVVMVNLDQRFQFLLMGEGDPFQLFLDALITLLGDEVLLRHVGKFSPQPDTGLSGLQCFQQDADYFAFHHH